MLESYPQISYPYDTGWPSGEYRYPANLVVSTSSAPSTSALATFLPFLIPRRTQLVNLGLYLTTAQAGAECRLGVYRDDNGAPRNDADGLLVDGGILDLSAGSGTFKQVTIAAWAEPSIVWSCCQLKNVATQVTVHRIQNAMSFMTGLSSALNVASGPPRYCQQSITYGSALPAAAGAVTKAHGGDAPVILMKAA